MDSARAAPPPRLPAMRSRGSVADMSSIRITATRPDGTVVDRLVEISNAQRLESALAKAFSDVLGSPSAARQLTEGEAPSKHCVTLHAYEGPRDTAAGPSPEDVSASRVIARFQVVRRRGRRLAGTWYGAEGELRPRARRG